MAFHRWLRASRFYEKAGAMDVCLRETHPWRPKEEEVRYTVRRVIYLIFLLGAVQLLFDLISGGR